MMNKNSSRWAQMSIVLTCAAHESYCLFILIYFPRASLEVA